ncbi:polyphosphate polymerase domain-containing protein [Chryseomicrobium sp. FSL W7-1435]|uniref:polyphosphate polymerase domain-containing protein n=1 Tax=Chryseomicrobium sp. FSL W7-1435 TaxID=2921704 RepID=UPI00315A966F
MKTFRHEYKYYIHTRDYDVVRHRLKTVLPSDEHSINDEGYLIRSLYFDNLFDSDLYQKHNGIFRRKKFRIRIYNHSDEVIKLERKSRQGEYILKTSLSISRAEYELIRAQEYEFLKERDDDLANEFYVFLQGEFMRPRVIVDYVREAYKSSISNVRITFDKELSFVTNSMDIFDKDAITEEVIDYPKMILEVKYDHFLPEYIRQMIQLDAHQRSAISKYVLCRMASIQYHGF